MGQRERERERERERKREREREREVLISQPTSNRELLTSGIPYRCTWSMRRHLTRGPCSRPMHRTSNRELLTSGMPDRCTLRKRLTGVP